MSVLALWDLDSALRNVLIEHLGSFYRMCPGAPASGSRCLHRARLLHGALRYVRRGSNAHFSPPL
jgi:hypothetical protein